MDEKPKKPTILNYQRPMRGRLLDNWPLVLGTIITFCILGVLALVKAFMATSKGSDGTLGAAGLFFFAVAFVIWTIEREW